MHSSYYKVICLYEDILYHRSCITSEKLCTYMQAELTNYNEISRQFSNSLHLKNNSTIFTCEWTQLRGKAKDFLRRQNMSGFTRSVHSRITATSPVSNVQTEYPFALLATGRDALPEQTDSLTPNIE